MAVVVERRRFARREVGLVIDIVPWGREAEPIRALTSDVSAGGMLLRTTRWDGLPVGQRVVFSILCPTPLDGESWHCSRLYGSGRVTRHQKGDGMPDSEWRGVAVTFDTPVRLR
jgi:hypothetical protein